MLMWSSIVQAPKLSQGQKSSDSSLGSSFGCSLGSFNNSATEGDLWLYLGKYFIVIYSKLVSEIRYYMNYRFLL